MAENQVGIGYESQILNAEEERVVEALSANIMEFGQPNHGDMKDDPIFAFTSMFNFVAYWQIVFPEMGKKIMAGNKYAISPMWGALTSLSCFLGGIRFVQEKFEGKEMPAQLASALQNFEELLVNEANETGSGTQKFVSERWERFQK